MEETPISNSQYPPGIRFHPSDEELISYYLLRKLKSLPLPPDVITDIHLYTVNPWDLPSLSSTPLSSDEWYFFTPRDRKYPNGGRPNRAAASGYWKATGIDHPIRSSSGSRIIGVKKTLVFYKGRPPSGHRMDWLMTEYRLPDTSRPSRTTGSMRLDDWVLCRIRQKGNMSKNERNLPAVCGNKDYTDMLSEYLQSNEYKLIVSLLAGSDPTAVIQSSVLSESTPCKEKYVTFQSESLAATTDTRSHVSQGNEFRPSNACISLQGLNMLPPLQESFLQ